MKAGILGKIESILLGLLLAPAPISFCFIAGWFSTVVLGFSEKVVSTSALSGLAAGLIITAVVLKNFVKNAYKFSNKILAALFVYYSILAFCFGMGIPVLNYFLGIIAGIYVVRKMYYSGAGETEYKYTIKRTAIFTSVIMFIICNLMVLIAIVGKVGPKDFETFLKSLFSLNLAINTAGFVSIIFFGACAMILLQYWMTKISAMITFKLSR